jgi:hypothetical protein
MRPSSIVELVLGPIARYNVNGAGTYLILRSVAQSALAGCAMRLEV